MNDVTAVLAALPPDSAPTPVWLTEPCPSWCCYPWEHADQSIAEDRRHLSAAVIVALSAEETQRSIRVGPRGLEEFYTDQPQEIRAVLDQHYREAEPLVRVHGDESSAYSVGLTLAEAEELARGILRLVDEARAQ